jgi:hypothetical protein
MMNMMKLCGMDEEALLNMSIGDEDTPLTEGALMRKGMEKWLGTMENLTDGMDDEERTKLCAKAVGTAARKVEKIMLNEPESEKKTRQFKPDTTESVKKWALDQMSPDIGGVVSCKTAHLRYVKWCSKRLEMGKALGYTPFLHFMRELDWTKDSTAVFENARIL